MRLLTKEEACDLLMSAFKRRYGFPLDIESKEEVHAKAVKMMGGLFNHMDAGNLEAYFIDGRVRVRAARRQ